MYVYICTTEGYGSDPIALSNDELRDLRRELRSPVDKSQSQAPAKAKLLAFIKEEVMATFSRLSFYDTYAEARQFVLARAFEEVEFSEEDPAQEK
jgi:hypothetical protein